MAETTETSSSSYQGIPRAEYLAWRKERALEYADLGNTGDALMSLIQDFGRRPDTADGADFVVRVGMPLAMGGQLATPRQLREFIEEFN